MAQRIPKTVNDLYAESSATVKTPTYQNGVFAGMAELPTGGDVAASTHASTSKATPVDADELPVATYKDQQYRDTIARRYGLFLMPNDYGYLTPHLLRSSGS